jgi:hypothetical protein
VRIYESWGQVQALGIDLARCLVLNSLGHHDNAIAGNSHISTERRLPGPVHYSTVFDKNI